MRTEADRALTSHLSERLRGETRTLHTVVERSTFMGALLRGQMNRDAYCMLLRNLHAIYTSLEHALLECRTHPLLAPLLLPALFRSHALAGDLNALHGPSWQNDIALQPATHRYVDRLHHLHDSDPALLCAHAYVRYLGDLSGGQVLKRIVAKSLQLVCGAGTSFYDFGDTDQTRDLTLAFRAGLGEMDASEAQTDAIVNEALGSFELHRTLFDELAIANGLTDKPTLKDR
ncbi:MAG: biliverdin-producing heme oxygenase [Burkholderiaceae bacterium]